MDDMNSLMEHACRLGASAAAVIATTEIVTDEELAKRCREPRCPDYGLALSCPPQVAGPEHFRKLCQGLREAIVVKIDLPSEVLYSCESEDAFRLLHEVVAGLEREAHRMGYRKARAFAGGSCKRIFCPDFPECPALTAAEKCRFPQLARPSMSGFGIDVAKLMAAAGWKMNWVTRDAHATPSKMASICGLALIR